MQSSLYLLGANKAFPGHSSGRLALFPTCPAPHRRDISRQEYLAKREQQKLDEMREALEDEKYLFQARQPSLCFSRGVWVVHSCRMKSTQLQWGCSW